VQPPDQGDAGSDAFEMVDHPVGVEEEALHQSAFRASFRLSLAASSSRLSRTHAEVFSGLSHSG